MYLEIFWIIRFIFFDDYIGDCTGINVTVNLPVSGGHQYFVVNFISLFVLGSLADRRLFWTFIITGRSYEQQQFFRFY